MESTPDPDWRDIAGKSRAWDGLGEDFTALGDPTRWGGSISQLLRPGIVSYTDHVLRVQCHDNYSRNWQLVGETIAAQDVWDETELWVPALEIDMGVGQSMITHRLLLRELIALATASTIYSPRTVGDRVSFAWVVSGGILGQAIGIRVVALGLIPPGPLTFETTHTMLISPLAAGTGL